MQRLTFGVNSSPFLAISTVHAHAKKYAELFPNAVQEILQTCMWCRPNRGRYDGLDYETSIRRVRDHDESGV